MSNDTLERFLEKAAVDKEKTCLSNLNPDAFTVVSIDNIDCLSRYTIISSDSKKERSWHGISVMAQQSHPKTAQLFPFEKISLAQRFNVVKSYGDGRCFYRCIAVHSCSSLQSVDRNYFGIPSIGSFFSLETMLADKIQSGIISILKENVHVLENLPQDVSRIFLEKQSGVFYESFNECLTDNSIPGTYACTLQILTTAFTT